MKLFFLIEDKCYLEALLESIRTAYKCLYVEIVSDAAVAAKSEQGILITDSRKQAKLFCEVQDVYPAIFLSDRANECREVDDKLRALYVLFKYRNINCLLSDLSQIMINTTGDLSYSSGLTRVIAVCSDDKINTSSICRSLASQTLFLTGNSVMLMSLCYLNEYYKQDSGDDACFQKLMYYLDIKREVSLDVFTYVDSYGIRYLNFNSCCNPVASLDINSLLTFIQRIKKSGVDTLILDISSEFSEVNKGILKYCDNILLIRSRGSYLDFKNICSDMSALSRSKSIFIQAEQMEIQMESYVLSIFEINRNNSNENTKRNSKRVQESNQLPIWRNKKTADR